jgi:hypothetical protein
MRLVSLSLNGSITLAAAAPQAADSPFTDPNPVETTTAQRAEYDAYAPKTIIELQPFRRTASVSFSGTGGRGTATLVDLSPQANSWFLLTIHADGNGGTLAYHLQNPLPRTQTLALMQDHPDGIRLVLDGHASDCLLWRDAPVTLLQRAQHTDLPYAPLCGNRLYLRNKVAGTYTDLERVTNFLRDDVWGGEKIIGFVKQQFYQDAFIEKAVPGAATALPAARAAPADAPRPPQVDPAFASVAVTRGSLGIEVDHGSGAMLMGQWYTVREADGIFLSVIQPKAVSAPSGVGRKLAVNALDPIEAGAMDYLVALDLSKFELGFALGSSQPRVGWSARVLDGVRDAGLPGPDGIGSAAPLVVNGMVNPSALNRVAATFAGGFKREHGAFHYGPLALRNHGSHYGFIEQGVVFSKLQPELATVIVMDDGGVQMMTWTAADDALLPRIRFARQNGVPLIEYDAETGTSSPGALVRDWGPGNWSGSEDERLRTLRAGLCLQVTGEARFLIFGYFSTATPSAMARVFQAYGCRYAMHLDMNALEHTYFALYSFKDGKIAVQHLIEGMAEVDRKGGAELAPRFLSFPDDRDFFYLTRKRSSP